MDGWIIAATLFAAGAFALGLLDEWRRFRSRPTWSWAAIQARPRSDARRHRVELQLISDHPAYHVTVEGVGLDLDQDHHDHAHDRTRWPHHGVIDPSDDPLVIYVVEDGSREEPRLDVTWMIPPMRRGRFLTQQVPVGPDARRVDPEPLGGRLPRLKRLRPRANG